MKTFTALAVICAAMLSACGGGDPEDHAEAEMPCKYRPDCTAGPPVGSAVDCDGEWCKAPADGG